MKTRSLILSPHEVRAALDGTLGLVVRPVKPQPANGLKWNAVVLNGYGGWTDEHGKPSPCPLGVPGDRLCCKETYCFKRLSHIPKTHTEVKCSEGPCYRGVTGGLFCHRDVGRDGTGSPLWMSPATMPAWASRITLDVVGVRCVSFGELSYADAKLCGFVDDGLGHFIPMQHFWNAKYAKRGLGWETNPFVWAAEVRRVDG